MIPTLLLLIGIVLLFSGGHWLVQGAVNLAARLGVAPVIIGMTVVAFGTSAPELVVNLVAVARGDTAIGFGNVVGSNIANIGLLLGLTALIWPLTVHNSIVQREIPMLILVSLAAIVLGIDQWFSQGDNTFTRSDGLILLLLFSIFLYYTLGDALKQRNIDPFITDSTEAATPAKQDHTSLLRAVLMVVVGLTMLVGGGQATVRGATSLALALGMPEVIVGLTIVAVGTSLPELATSLLAAKRGQTDIAVGNIVGSNLFNLLFIWGLSNTIAPSAMPEDGQIDLIIMTLFAIALLPFAMTRRTIDRVEGGTLLLAYAAYVGWLAYKAIAAAPPASAG